MKQIVYMLIGLLVGFILAGALFLVIRLPDGKSVNLEPSPTKELMQVQVLGGVVRPGVYSFPEGSRVQDAVTAAGGLLAGIDPNSINLVAKLQDGQQLTISGAAAAGEGSGPPGPFAVVPTSNAPFTVISTPGASAPSSELININNASLNQLEGLPGIGPTTAQNIIDYRTQHGPFSAISGIMNVPGIGPATFDSIQNLITVH